ncbi:MAG: hypothetical protein HRU29_15465 [Rhizobiales bacterium]|nr:hypothetical protein [Hyphomicrobiales bacterium]NRB15795.1 hypothetical protein [Hyphomicrobiales bacterium]
MSTGHVELAGLELTMGILTGLVLFVILETAVLYFNFGPWFKKPNLSPGPSPERYIGAAIHSFVAMVVTGGILTLVFSNLDFENNPITNWYGFNNICILFDSAPSTYISPVFWFFVAYLIVRFAVEDTKRLVQMQHISSRLRSASYASNVFLVIVAAAFSLCLAVAPEDNMYLHTAPFIGLVVAFPLIFVMHCFQDPNRTNKYIVAAGLFMTVSIVKSCFLIIALIQFEGFRHVPVSIAQPVDVFWTLMALSAPFLMPPPKIIPTEQYAN